ncbi:hypothetical protein GCM10027404_33260 [Arthrobacter tumbae]
MNLIHLPGGFATGGDRRGLPITQQRDPTQNLFPFTQGLRGMAAESIKEVTNVQRIKDGILKVIGAGISWIAAHCRGPGSVMPERHQKIISTPGAPTGVQWEQKLATMSA